MNGGLLNDAPKLLISGVLVADKPAGWTSHDVVAKVKRALGAKKVGHLGTLDPMATGVLPLVLGRATRLAQFLTAGNKDYAATIAFGRSTNTYDGLGTITATSSQRPSLRQVETALARYRGTFEQTPPAFSAKNIAGERAYDIARKSPGAAPVLPKAVTVTVTTLEIQSFDGETLELRLQVAAGFYVRSLAHDLGAALGMGAVLVGLRRTRSGGFGLDTAVPLADVLQAGRDALATRVLPFSALLTDVPSVTLRSAAHVERVKNGLEVSPTDVVAVLNPVPDMVRLLGPDGLLVGLAKPGKTDGFLHAAVVLV